MEKKLCKYQSFKELTRDRQKYSFSSFLHLLSDHVQFNEEYLIKVFPGLREQVLGFQTLYCTEKIKIIMRPIQIGCMLTEIQDTKEQDYSSNKEHTSGINET